jgi:hypothetical protein
MLTRWLEICEVRVAADATGSREVASPPHAASANAADVSSSVSVERATFIDEELRPSCIRHRQPMHDP